MDPSAEPLDPRFWSGSKIFFTYLAVCLSLTLLSIRSIYIQSTKTPKRPSPGSGWAKLLFIALAVISIGSTWYHMFMFFDWSLGNYIGKHPSRSYTHLASAYSPADVIAAAGTDEQVRAEAWLRGTSLFAQAWGAALETDERSWWTLQIFPMATAWGMWLGREGTRRRMGVAAMMIFTFLGFLVAISFAMNLSLLAVLYSPAVPAVPTKGTPDSEREKKAKPKASPWTPSITDMLLFGSAIILPGATGMLQESAGNPTAPEFMAPLLLLHANIVLLVVGVSVLTKMNMGDFRLRGLWIVSALALPTLIKKPDGVLVALYSHPAVSSVGWDVIMCWISVMVWGFVEDKQ